jgi:hypothetical protein
MNRHFGPGVLLGAAIISRHCVGADSLSLDAKIVHAKQP